MDATHFASLAVDVRKLPAGAGRDRQLHKITDLFAAAEAAAALETVAAGARQGVVAQALTSARAVVGGNVLADDPSLRDRLRDAVSSTEFLALVPAWIRELRQLASTRPETGACTVASALDLWSWTMNHFRNRKDGAQAVDEVAEAVAPLLAARALALDASRPPKDSLRADLSHVNAARVAASIAATCAEVLFGYRRHQAWDAEGCATCYGGNQVDALEGFIPGIASGARSSGDVVEADGSHEAKAGPCVQFDGVETFLHLRQRLDGCLTGARLARDRAAAALVNSEPKKKKSKGKS